MQLDYATEEDENQTPYTVSKFTWVVDGRKIDLLPRLHPELSLPRVAARAIGQRFLSRAIAAPRCASTLLL